MAANAPTDLTSQSLALAPQTDQVNFISQLGGNTNAIAVQGQYAYLSEGPALTILDISDPAAPQIVGKTNSLTGLSVTDVAVSGELVYALSDSRLITIDVSDPENPVLVSDYSLPSEGGHKFAIEEIRMPTLSAASMVCG